jgi:hypothetical protein
MNKKELIERIECLKNIFGNKNEYVKIDMVVELISELDEPQPVKVPQFVADWIEECEAKEKTLLNSLLYTPEGVNSWVGNSDNQETFARAWLDGYEVEEEKRYHVKINGEIEENLLVYGLGIHRYFFARTYDSSKRNGHTRKELEEAGFGEVFNSPLFEVEEVTE